MRKIFQITLTLLITLSTITAQDTVYMAPDGIDTNNGSIDYPVQTLNMARNLARQYADPCIKLRSGRYPVTSTCVLDANDNGLSISAYKNEKVVFDGGLTVASGQFELVTDAMLLDKLHNDAKGKVYSQVITDSDLLLKLSSRDAQMSHNTSVMTEARYPNIGFAHANVNTINTSNEATGQDGTTEAPLGGSFTLYESEPDFSKWNTELSNPHQSSLTGYFSAEWLPEYLNIATVSASGSLQLADGSAYGLKKDCNQVRFYIQDLLCELDESGEWKFDTNDNRLYVWTDENPQTQIFTVWGGTQFMQVNASDITLENFVVENIMDDESGVGTLEINGENNLIAGVTLRNMFKVAFRLNGRSNTLLSCDIFDTLAGIMSGGSFNSEGVSRGNNTIENCHFTRIYAKNMHQKIAHVGGAGNTFRNNLIHNTSGQPLTYGGVDHDISLNEIFNVGFEEGDGGAVYTGADAWQYGNELYHNFTHHIMSVQGLKYGRAAFFQDDYSGGGKIYENVFYKAGSETLKMNGGSGMYYHGNILLEGYAGLKTITRTSLGTNAYNKSMTYFTDETKRWNTDKENYIGRMIRAIGSSDWSTATPENWHTYIGDFWKTNYDYFADVINYYQDNNTMFANQVRLYENYFYGYSYNEAVQVGLSDEHPNVTLSSMDIFSDIDALDFSYAATAPSDMPTIPFDSIGLYKDEYRCQVPDKDTYRAEVKAFFNNSSSHPSGSYDYENVNDNLYYNTGKILTDMIACDQDVVLSASLSVKEVAVEGTSNLEFCVTLNDINNSGADITFGFDDLGTGTATTGIDYAAIVEDAKIVVPSGSDRGVVILEVSDDNTNEYNETIDVLITNPSNAFIVIEKSSVTATIQDNDAYVASISTLNNGSEDTATDIEYLVSLNRVNDSGNDLLVSIVDSEQGTATSSLDYTVVNDGAVVTIANAEQSAVFTLPVIDDTNFEVTETVIMKIVSSDNIIILDSVATATIDDEDTVTAVLANTSAMENDPIGLVFTVTLSEVNETDEDISFSFKDLEDGSAYAGIDYEEIPWFAEIVVPIGSDSGTYVFTLIDDTKEENTETIEVEISACSSDRVFITESTAGGSILDNERIASITDNDLNQEFTVYPNPVVDLLTISAKDELLGAQLTVMSVDGVRVMSQTIATSILDISALAPGIYHLSLVKENKIYNTKFIKL